MKLRIFVATILLCLAGTLIAACAGPELETPPAEYQYTEQESRQIALEFLTNEPTYLFDGIIETVELVETVPGQYPNSWVFTYEFDSRHAGYGDRTDQMLAQVITPHHAVITVHNGNVTQAIMDNTWDMASQMIMATEEESLKMAEDFLRNSPTYKFDGIEGSIKHVETLKAFCPFCWAFVFEFESAHAGYGDRTGEMLAEVITTHEAIISVSQGNVDGGTIDRAWDIVYQRDISRPEIETAEHEQVP